MKAFIIGLLTLLIIFLGIWKIQKAVGEQGRYEPVLLLHGFLGGERSYKTLMERFEENGQGYNAAVCRVNERGVVSCEHKYHFQQKADQFPLVQVIFEDDHASISKQGKWVKNVVKKLKENEKMEGYHLVGHSMGGLAAIKYLEKTKDKNVKSLTTIGTPVGGLDIDELAINYPKTESNRTSEGAKDLQYQSEAITKLQKEATKLKELRIPILSVAGNVKHKGGDGSVLTESAFTLENYVPNVKKKEFPLLHSALHESSAVDKVLYTFLKDSEKDDRS
ncbi:alpha/beta fold hydrolase [Priestia endophytica]|uniref:alpha/beta fold hydrolase n=1 Tax=Priestia endophytica TaxID=135735 RepID=UPI000FBD598C|nr:alpha/beta fold hydrolase [Priestia endophytica]MED4072978.1 alpha/beta hydrolase [Priestia endophytica]RPK12590.1 hypothetical protein FH5_02796 [Priestia endophytica]